MRKMTKRGQIRFACISMLLAELDKHGCIRHCSAKVLDGLRISHGAAISESTLYRWYRQYRERGWQFVEEEKRPPPAPKLSQEFLDFLSREKTADPEASIPEILLRARYRGILSRTCRVDRTTVYRHAKKMNLPFYKHSDQKNVARPFEYPHRMQMVLCDGKHFRANGLKRVAFFYLDDATRHVLAVKVGASETSLMFLRGLYEVIAKYGKMDRLYVDHGSSFTAGDVERVGMALDIPIIFGRVGYPAARGKIEKFNQTVLAGCLRGLDKPGIDASFAALELRLQHYLDHIYSQTEHSSTGKRPAEAFSSDSKTLDYPKDKATLQQAFAIGETRKATADNCISYQGCVYELPFGYAGKVVALEYRLLCQELWHVDSGIRLHLADKHHNARSKRAKIDTPQPSKHEPSLIETAAELAFNEHFSPIVDDDGGFTIPHKGTKNDD